MKRKANGKARTKTDVGGLHLWAVYLNNRSDDNLWITTRTLNVQQVTKKAWRFMLRHRDEYKDCWIVEVKNQGTIDA